jgi:hypothetical protein
MSFRVVRRSIQAIRLPIGWLSGWKIRAGLAASMWAAWGAAAASLGCGRIGYDAIEEADLSPPIDSPDAARTSVTRVELGNDAGATTSANDGGLAAPDSGTTGGAPPRGASWQIQLAGTIDTSVDVPFYIVDMDTPAGVIAKLHAAGRFVSCYFSAGTWEPARSDASEFPASSLGNTLADYPQERWVDIRQPAVLSIMRARIESATSRGCDGISASGLNAFVENNGFGFTRSDQLGYDRSLAAAAHAAGRSIGLEDGDVTLAGDLVSYFEWIVVWDCLDATCNPAVPFTAIGKPGFLVSTGTAAQAPTACAAGARLGLSTIIKNVSLDSFRVGCP